MPVRPNACHIGASCESFFLLQFFASTLVCTYTYKRIYTHEFVYDRFTNEKRIVKVKLLRWCRVINERKKKKKLEKKKRKRIDACTVYFHHFWILCTLTLLIYGIFVDVYRTTKREIGGQPFNDTIRSLFFFFTMITMFFCREALLRLHNYRSKCGAWKISLQYFFSSYFGGMQMHLRGTFWHE